MTNDNGYIWLTTHGIEDPRGWSDSMQEVAKEQPMIAEHIRDEELGQMITVAAKRVD